MRDSIPSGPRSRGFRRAGPQWARKEKRKSASIRVDANWTDMRPKSLIEAINKKGFERDEEIPIKVVENLPGGVTSAPAAASPMPAENAQVFRGWQRHFTPSIALTCVLARPGGAHR